MVQYLGRNTIDHMAYTTNPAMPRVRRDAVAMVGRKYTVTQVARRYGVGSSTICKWMKKARVCGHVPNCHPFITSKTSPKANRQRTHVEDIPQAYRHQTMCWSHPSRAPQWGCCGVTFNREEDTWSYAPHQKTQSFETLPSSYRDGYKKTVPVNHLFVCII
jgi:hypothetical protein